MIAKPELSLALYHQKDIEHVNVPHNNISVNLRLGAFPPSLCTDSCVVIKDCPSNGVLEKSAVNQLFTSWTLTTKKSTIAFLSRSPVTDIFVHFHCCHKEILVNVEINDMFRVEVPVRKDRVTFGLS